MTINFDTDCIEIFKKGMFVRIDKDCSATNKKFSLVSNMLNMRGKVYKISVVERNKVTIDGFIWAGEDLTIVEDPSKDSLDMKGVEASENYKVEIVTFNPSDLVI